MIATPPDLFDEWMRLPVVVDEPCDARFEVRRAQPQDFDRIYDVVDAAFGRKRARAQYDWLYRENPFGRARCWIVALQATGEILKTGASFAWPIQRGDEVLKGALSGDACTLPQWQRKGLSAVRRPYTRAHPWYAEICGVAGPNQGSRTVSQKSGQGYKHLGALRGGFLPLHTKALMRRAGAPSLLATALGPVADFVFSGWQGWAERGAQDAPGHVEEVSRFSVDFDEVTERCMSFPQFWSPHNADFLNWRYLDHPVESYVALALVEDEKPIGYAVLCLEAEKATLSEFAVEVAASGRALKLLSGVLGTARAAGCASVNFFGTPGWRHWPLFRRAGFIPYATQNHLETFGKRFEPEVNDVGNWQVMPGDRDFR